MLAADGSVRGHGQRPLVWRGPPRRCRCELGALGQDCLLEALERRAGLKRESLDQAAPAVAVDLERLGLAITAIEREHELAARALAQRMLRYECLQVGDQIGMPTERELGLDAFLQRDQAKLLEPLDVHPGERLEFQIGQRPAAPQALRLAQRPRRAIRVALGPSSSPVPQQPLEALEVELSGLDLQHVPRRAGEQHRALAAASAQCLAQARHVDFDGVARGRGRLVGPQFLDKTIARHHPTGVQQQDRQPRALLGPAERKPLIALADLERAKDAEVHVSADRVAASLSRIPTTAPPRAACERSESRL